MVSGPPRGIFVFELLFFHSTPCFLGFSGLKFPEFSRIFGLSPRAQGPFWTPRVPTPSCRKVCVKPGRWGRKIRKSRKTLQSPRIPGIWNRQKRQTPHFSKKMVSGPWRFWEIRPIFAIFAFFSKMTPKIGVFPPKIGYFRLFSALFGTFTGTCLSGPAATPKFREIFGKFSGRRRLAGGPPWTPFGPPLDPLGTLFGVPPGPFGVRLGSVWGSVWGPVWGSVWGPFGTRLGPVWDPMETLYGPYGYVCQTIFIGFILDFFTSLIHYFMYVIVVIVVIERYVMLYLL